MARPPKVSAETVVRLTDAIRAGNYYEAACAYARISYSTMRNWINRAEAERAHIEDGGRPRKGEAEYLEFLEALEKAEADAEVRLVAQWQQHAPSSWQACRDFLGRRFPERWGRKDEQKITGLPGPPTQVIDLTNLNDDQYLKALKQLTERTEPDDAH